MELFVLLLLLAAAGAVCVGVYNRINPLRHRVRETAANCMIARDKRNKLVSRLTSIAESYVGHERLVLLRVSADSRAEASAGTRANFFSSLTTSFPELKADTTYRQLMNDLLNVERELQDRLEIHNAEVRMYNTAVSSFPAVLLAVPFGFQETEYLKPTDRILDLQYGDELPMLRGEETPPLAHQDAARRGSQELPAPRLRIKSPDSS